ncbi:MAG: mlaE 2 [Gammaproteobacteria bacterium]|jgi:phospholipid/cholesterol/gamma-HCH transport system permease protein|nr:mlaE 2 [Gammaproteobacteria bacterium]
MNHKSTDQKTDWQLEDNTLICQGNWDISHSQQLNQRFNKVDLPAKIAIDGSKITKLDSVGALLLSKIANKYQARLQNFSNEHATLLKLVGKNTAEEQALAKPTQHNLLYRIGKNSLEAYEHTKQFLAFIGELVITLIKTTYSPGALRWREIVSNIESGGYKALPIIGLLSFLIGVVLAYQMGIQLQTYGANVFIVNFVGLAILREFGPLLTAIIIAGRTGSAFTAQLGMMQINEEIDALRAMGIAPIELLVLPRIFALIIALPLLSVWSDIFGVLGGMLMAKSMLGINFYDFLKRFQDVIQLKTYAIGLVKTPVFALIIASIGCYQGLQVSGSAESVGRLTTKSVVQAIFFIIVADAGFSILFSWLGI